MSPEEAVKPFDTIEGVQEYMDILASTILDVMKELKVASAEATADREERRERAILLAEFKLKMLGCYVHKSRRALNDLRLLRRLILNERMTAETAMATL